MHSCHVCPYNLSVPGGVRTHILDLCATLQDQSHKVSIIGSYDQRGPYTTLPVHRVGGEGIRLPLWGTVIDVLRLTRADKQRIRDFLLTEKVDVMHFHTPWTPFISFQILKIIDELPVEARPKRIATFHDTPPDTLWGRFLGAFIMPVAARYLMRKFEHVISVSEPQKKYLVRFSQQSVKVIPNGFRFKEPGYDTLIKDDIRHAPDPRKLPQNLLFLSRLEPRKGVIHALRVFQRLQPRYPNLHLLIAGEGGAERSIRDFIWQYQLPNVSLLGYVDEDRKTELFKDADVYLAPALYGESFGIVLLEAMAAGTPVAGYGNAGYRNVVEGYAPENFPEPGDVTALSARVDVLLSDPVYRKAVIGRGLKHARTYDWNTIAASVLEVYES